VSKSDPHYFGHRKRLRDRFLKAGTQGLGDYEIVELLLTLAIPRADVKEPAKRLIQQFGNLRGILDASIEDLGRVKGIGFVASVGLKIVRATGALYLQEVAEGQEDLTDSSRLADLWRMRIGGLSYEVFEVGYLDSADHLVRDGIETLEEGTVDRAVVYPRRVVESALRREAAGLVLAHNHPNQNVEPTEQDKLLTRAIVLAAEAVSLKIVDHLVVAVDDVFSFKKAGLL